MVCVAVSDDVPFVDDRHHTLNTLSLSLYLSISVTL